MTGEPDRDLTANLVAAAAAAAMAETYGDLVDLFAGQGRSGVVVHLRQRAQALARSASARDQVKSCAMDAAADDVAWGRSPLRQWSVFFARETWPGEPERQGVRPAADPDPERTREAAEVWARELESRLMRHDHDVFEGAARLSQRMAEEARLQATLWDDPRIPASPGTRRLMRAGRDVLQRRLRELGAAAPKPGAASAQARPGLVERILRRLRRLSGSVGAPPLHADRAEPGPAHGWRS
jgi:hypothetical protein